MTPQMVEAVARVIPAPAILFGQNPKMMVRAILLFGKRRPVRCTLAHHEKVIADAGPDRAAEGRRLGAGQPGIL